MSNESIKEKVKSKLKELGAFVDDELPDYIMVMVANKKSKDMMMEDLQLFLSSDTKTFCDWLHDDLLKSRNHRKNQERRRPSRTDERARSRSPIMDSKDIMSVSFNSGNNNEFENEEEMEREQKAREMVDYQDLDEDVGLRSSIKVVNKSENRETEIKMFKKAIIEARDSVTGNKSDVKSRIGHRNRRSNNNDDFRQREDHNQSPPRRSSNGKRVRPDIRSRLGAKVIPDFDEMDTETGDSHTYTKRMQLSSPERFNENVPISDHLPENLERCRFWPNCNKPDGCKFIHPTESCKSFPNCKQSATTCMYIHPQCKFDGECTRPDCAYTHNKPKVAPIAGISPAMTCKFFPNCTNKACPFVHPIIPKQMLATRTSNGFPCRYGNECRNRPSCPYQHPAPFKAHNVSNMKWVNPNLANKADTIGQAGGDETAKEDKMPSVELAA